LKVRGHDVAVSAVVVVKGEVRADAWVIGPFELAIC
jgi:hypothetical protein